MEPLNKSFGTKRSVQNDFRMTETENVNRNSSLNERVSRYSPDILKTDSFSDSRNARFYSKSLPLPMKRGNEDTIGNGDVEKGKKIYNQNKFVNKSAANDWSDHSEGRSFRLDLSGISKCTKGTGSEVEGERTDRLHQSKLSISTLSLSSSNEADSIVGEEDCVAERFWKMIAKDDNDLGGDVGSCGDYDDDDDKFVGSQSSVNGSFANGNIFIRENSAKSIEIESRKSNKSSLESKTRLKGKESGDDGSMSLTRVTEMSFENISCVGNGGWNDDGINSFDPGMRYQSTPKYVKHVDEINEFDTIMIKDEMNNERLAIEFYKKLSIRRECKCKAKAWVKWTTNAKRKAKERMRSVFVQWKETHLQMKREFLLMGSVHRRELKQNYYEWKLSFDAEHRSDIASFHFKLSVLTRCLQLWKVYIAERRVKAKMKKVARLHFEFHFTKQAFIKWKDSVGKSSVFTRNINKRLLLRVFNGWRKWTQYSRMLHKRHLSSCKEYHNRTLMKATFEKWKCQLNMKISLKHRIISMQKRAFTLWQLKCQRILLRRRISIVHSNLVLQRKCFNIWKEFTTNQLGKRKLFVKKIQKLYLKDAFMKWRSSTDKILSIKENRSLLMAAQQKRALQKAFGKWKQKIDVIRFMEKVAVEQLKRNVRNAAIKWRNKIIKKKLQQRLLASAPFFEFLKLKRIFRHWLREKQKADREKQRGKVMASFIRRGCLSRVFTEWRIVTQEDRTIHHMVSRIQRRDLARSFDGWRLIVTRKKVSMHYRRVKELEKAEEIFYKWRNEYIKKAREKDIRVFFARKRLTRVLSAWKEFIDDKKQRTKDLMIKYGNKWQKNCAIRIEARERREAAMANRRIVLKTRFRLWARKCDEFQRKRIENENLAKEYMERTLKIKSLNRWRRQFHVHCIVSEYQEDKRISCLDNAFNQWKEFVQQQLQDAVGRFTDRLERESPRSLRNHTLSESYSSGDIPLLRSSSGYFGSLPNIAKMSSPLPVSPLATGRSNIGPESPASLSPDHPYDRSPRYGLTERSYTFSSPNNEERNSSLERSRLLMNERPKSPNSIQSSGSLSSKTKSPVIVPPLFTNGYRDDDEEYTELSRPSSLPPFEPLNQAKFFLQREKSTDDESPGSIDGHNFDEDAMSYYSFRSESNGVNRENLISGTIRHWRHLPLSKTFRAWYKYTQDKKLRMELFNHFVSCKRNWTVRRIFLGWHRKLYCRLVSEKFARAILLKKYFKAVCDHLLQEKVKRERNLIAQLHLKNMKLSSVFKSWRRKVSAKRKLHSLVGRWQEAVHISENDKMKSDKMIKKREFKVLRNAFDTWKDMNAKFMAANELSDILLLKRNLRLWHNNVRENKLRKVHFDKVLLMRSRKVFIKWKSAYNAEKKAQEHSKNLQILRFKTTFYSWLDWTKETKRLSDQVIKFQQRTNFKLIAQAFFIWSEEAARVKVADDHYKEMILIRIIESWHEYTERRIDLSVRCQDYQASSTRTKMRNVFDWWKRSAICSGVFKERQKLQREALLAKSFSRWKKEIRQTKAEKHFKQKMTRKTFSKWFQKCFRLNRQRRLAANAARIWLFKTRANQSLEERCLRHAENKEKVLKQKMFNDWRDATNHLRIARAHFEANLVFKTMNFWHETTTRRHKLREIKETTERFVELNLVSSAFYLWIDLYHRRNKNEMVLANYLELKQQEMLKLCLINFRINALKSRSEKHNRTRTLKMVWKHWSDAVYRRNTIARIQKRLLRMLALKYATRWRKRTKDLISLGLIADGERKKRDSIQLKNRFQSWVLKTRARSLAKMCFQGHLLKSTFIRWKTSTKLKVSRKKLLLQFKEKKKKEEIEKTFRKWKDSTIKSQKEKKLDEIHEQIAKAHFRKSLIEKYFYGWHNECLIEKLRRKRDLKICAEYFRIWKNECLGENRAVKMYDYNLMEKVWKKWRRSKIKLEVMRAMEDHENRKQLSEVFSAWYNYTYIRRHAIKDFQNIKLKKAFRKWMQEYNKS